MNLILNTSVQECYEYLRKCIIDKKVDDDYFFCPCAIEKIISEFSENNLLYPFITTYPGAIKKNSLCIIKSENKKIRSAIVKNDRRRIKLRGGVKKQCLLTGIMAKKSSGNVIDDEFVVNFGFFKFYY